MQITREDISSIDKNHMPIPWHSFGEIYNYRKNWIYAVILRNRSMACEKFYE